MVRDADVRRALVRALSPLKSRWRLRHNLSVSVEYWQDVRAEGASYALDAAAGIAATSGELWVATVPNVSTFDGLRLHLNPKTNFTAACFRMMNVVYGVDHGHLEFRFAPGEVAVRGIADRERYESRSRWLAEQRRFDRAAFTLQRIELSSPDVLFPELRVAQAVIWHPAVYDDARFTAKYSLCVEKMSAWLATAGWGRLCQGWAHRLGSEELLESILARAVRSGVLRIEPLEPSSFRPPYRDDASFVKEADVVFQRLCRGIEIEVVARSRGVSARSICELVSETVPTEEIDSMVAIAYS